MANHFQAAYAKLNPAQKKAVDEIDGPVMVIAGPGTGKTQVLTTRIANILAKTDTDPHSILALTYTESAAANMRERLVKLIGKDGYYVQIATFHAFCSEIIATHSEYFDLNKDSQPLTDLEKYRLFTDIISDLKLEALKPLNDPTHYLKSIIGSISDLKRENVSLDDFSLLIETEARVLEGELTKTARTKLEKKIQKNQELAVIYAEYQLRLRRNLRFDFDDMIKLVVEALDAHEELLLDLQENLHYFLVDEYQDTNSAQNKILDQLASYWSDRPNLFVVGDPNQSIFRFQGASVENALSFTDKYPETQVITLTTGYRCPQPLYDLAHGLIRQNNLTQTADLTPNLNPRRLAIIEELDKKISGRATTGVVVHRRLAPSRTAELIQVAEIITDLVNNHQIKYSDIAILYRDNADALSLKEILYRWQIPFSLDSANNVLENELVRQLLYFCTIIDRINENDREYNLFEVFTYHWFNPDPLPVMKLAKIATNYRLSLVECLDQGYAAVAGDCQKFGLTETDFSHLQALLYQLRHFKSEDGNLIFSTWFELAINNSGFLTHIKTLPEHLEIITSLKSLFDQIKNLNQIDHALKLRTFLTAIDLMKLYRIPIKAETIKLSEDAVHLSTVHKAKGQEWDYVFVIDVVDGKWGNRRLRQKIVLPEGVLKNTNLDKKDRDEDDRRLFYVAMTRARQALYLSSARSYVSGSSEKALTESIFLSELAPPKLIKLHAEVEIAPELLIKLVEKPAATVNQDQKTREFFTELVKTYQLSATDLQTYLRDPQEFKEKVLLKLPRAKAPFFAFGTAIHASLEFMFAQHQQSGSFPKLKPIIDYFATQLQREILLPEEYDRRLKYGQTVLEQYYQNQLGQPIDILALEKKLGGLSRPIVIDQHIRLKGRIDRLDWLDRDRRQIKVIDYKTGKAKSVNQIEGQVSITDYSPRELALPENIRGTYKRQLLFYKLLIENDPSTKLTVTHGAFEFVEPTATGKLVTRLFELKDEDVATLKALITEVMAEIKALKFLETPTVSANKF